MSTGTHRKPSDNDMRIPGIPWGYILTGLTLLALCIALLAGLTMAVSAPAQASTTGYLQPAVTAARNLGPTVDAWTRFLTMGGGVGMGINPSALPREWNGIS